MDVEAENQIIASVQQVCIEEFEHLVRLYQGPLFRVVGNLVNPPHRYEDLVQDIFLATYKNIGRFDPRKGSFRSWLYAIARNRTLNARRKYREDRLPDDAIIADGRTPMDDLVVKEAFQILPTRVQDGGVTMENHATMTHHHTRKPLIAILLAVAATGLGHIYCGRLIKGLVLFFVSFAFAPIIVAIAYNAASTAILVVVIASLFPIPMTGDFFL